MAAEFSNRTKAEIERNRFAATTGALVQLSAPAYREILAAAQKWLAHEAKAYQAAPEDGNPWGLSARELAALEGGPQ